MAKVCLIFAPLPKGPELKASLHGLNLEGSSAVVVHLLKAFVNMTGLIQLHFLSIKERRTISHGMLPTYQPAVFTTIGPVLFIQVVRKREKEF